MTPPSNTRIVCDCLGVTEAELVVAIRDGGLKRLDEVAARTSAGDGCMGCHPLLQRYLRRVRAEEATCSPRPSAARRDSSRSLPI